MGEGTRERLLIVNADDFGYCAGVSEGIRLVHRQGIVSSTSVMMTMPAALVELERLRREAPTLGVGIHLTVTEGRPYRLPRFWDPAELVRGLAKVRAAALRAEWQAQIETFLATGLPLTHLDSHHHAAYRHSKALAILFELARQYRVPVRNPYPIGDADADALAGCFPGSGLRYPQHFVDVFDRPPLPGTLVQALEALPVGVTELMCHPGLVDDELRRASPSGAEVRAQELAALTDPEARIALDRLGIRRVSFAVLGGA